MDIAFQTPEKDKNVTNVIAGINGSGKSSLLEFILMFLGGKSQTINNGHNQQVNLNIDFSAGSLRLNSFGTLTQSNYGDYWKKLNDNIFKNFKIINYETSTMRNGITKTFQPSASIIKAKIINLDSDVILGMSEEFIKEHIVNELMNSSVSNPSRSTIYYFFESLIYLQLIKV